MLDQARALAGQLGGRRLAMMGGIAAILMAALAYMAMGSANDRQMGFLYTDLDPAAAQSIADKLKAQNIAFSLSADGTSIMAPQDKLAELRMTMAGEKLGGKIGYDVLDNEQPFGISASRAKLDETRAIEGELARSIQSLDAVVKARVHIVMPERELFATDTRKASAAVTVKTRGLLPGESIESIRYLVSSSVPSLTPEAVSIIDQTGALLARAGEAGGTDGGSVDGREAMLEARMRNQITALLEPIVGVGKVRAEVTTLLDRDQAREETQVYDPDKQVIAHQTTVDSKDQGNENQAGPQGVSVSTQLPGNQAAPAGAPGDARTAARNETSEDTIFANSGTTSVIVRSPGKLQRVNVAVMVDAGAKGLPAPLIQRLTKVVESAVGIDRTRGDSVVVESMPFLAEAGVDGMGASWLSEIAPDQILGVVKILVVGIVGLIALRMVRSSLGASEPKIAAVPGMLLTPAEGVPVLPGEAGAALRLAARQEEADEASAAGEIKQAAVRRIGDAVISNPPEAAAVIRQWLHD